MRYGRMGEEYDETRDMIHMPRKKGLEPENGQEDLVGTDREPIDWNAVGDNGEPPF